MLNRKPPRARGDIQECQWLLKLHVYGLLRNSFRPPQQVLQLRTYWRQPSSKSPMRLFVLQQEFDSYQMFHQRIEECDRRIQAHYETLPSQADAGKLGATPRNKRPRGHVPQGLDLRQQLYRTTGRGPHRH